MKEVPEQWLREGRAQLLPHEISVAFDRYIMTLPWEGSALDWDRLPRAEAINVVTASPAEFQAWVSRIALATHAHMAVWYSESEGGIVVPTDAGIAALDELYWKYASIRFCFGVDIVDGAIVPSYKDLLQYGKGDLYIAVSAASPS